MDDRKPRVLGRGYIRSAREPALGLWVASVALLELILVRIEFA
jgi:hypothetical protein